MTDFEAKAREIAPCNCGVDDMKEPKLPHTPNCNSRFWPAIVQALRENDRAVREECANVEWEEWFATARSNDFLAGAYRATKAMQAAIRATIKEKGNA